MAAVVAEAFSGNGKNGFSSIKHMAQMATHVLMSVIKVVKEVANREDPGFACRAID